MAELPENDTIDPWAEWIKRQCDKWSDETDDTKVLLIQLYAVTYGYDLSRYLDSKELDYYVERFGCKNPLEFYIIGSFDAQVEAAEYVYDTYADLDVTRTFHWFEGVDGCHDDYTVHELTGCNLEEFREKVRTLYNK